MFKISLSDRYTWTVSVEVIGDGGKATKHTFEAQFRRLSQSEIDAMIAGLQSKEIGDAQVIEQVLVGWKGIQDAGGQEIHFGETTRDQVLDVYPVRPAVLQAWFESLQGAKRKNS
ncbi:MAG: hypothetical protein AB7Q29_19900 [Vicinamibacterales bacterium]